MVNSIWNYICWRIIDSGIYGHPCLYGWQSQLSLSEDLAFPYTHAVWGNICIHDLS